MAMALAYASVNRSPTFFVQADRQRGILDSFQRREQHLAEAYAKNKALCFSASTFQQTHPAKAMGGHKDADATVASPLVLGVADGVSQVEEFGMDPSLLPRELLRYCENLGTYQLLPGAKRPAEDAYKGPIPLLQDAFDSTRSLGSTTAVLAVIDNSTRIHSKLHPMIAVISVGDCELLILRRTKGRASSLEAVFHTEMQRIDGHVQLPLQIARVDERIDPSFDDSITREVIEKGSAVHCVSAYEGDIVILGSDGVFDNLFLDELVSLCNQVLQPNVQAPAPKELLSHLACCIVRASHAKSARGVDGQLAEAPIGPGGKMDDTSVVVAEVVEWSQAHQKAWLPRKPMRRPPAAARWLEWFGIPVSCCDGISELAQVEYEEVER